MQKIKIGISACLLGENLRYDGGNRLQARLIEELGEAVRWLPVCPEVECGLPVPREEMSLTESPDGLRLKCIYSGKDHTARMEDWARLRIGELAGEGPRGFVFKSRSPNCGLAVSLAADGPGTTAGIFARLIQSAFPELPVAEETGLEDAPAIAAFMERVSAFR
ncbi:MAG: DUF523 domain-containing protein [Actinobacteria bacterium]|nr:DUF523 domain-containing protein [Actinomycetota bacterium]MCL5883451.1 DUF523 domain-containing protein [Actinomycetota bacterium]